MVEKGDKYELSLNREWIWKQYLIIFVFVTTIIGLCRLSYGYCSADPALTKVST